MSKEKDDLSSLLVSLRDAYTKAAKAIDVYLHGHPPVEVKAAEVADLFPDDIRGSLIFEHGDKEVIIRPRQYLGSDVFARVATVVRDHGGEYVSAGRESHFRLPRDR